MARQPKYLMSTAELVKKIAMFCEAYSGIKFYPYQSEWSNRMIRSMLENDGEELSALLARQCIPEGTLIHTRDGGLVKIEDHPNSWVTNENAEILEVTINGGYTIRCTANHPIMTKDGWVQAGLLKKGDWAVVLDEWNCFGDGLIEYSFTRYINKSRSDEVNLTYQMNDELAELVGWLTSDGYVNGKGQSIKFTNNNLNYLDRVEYLVIKYFPDIKPKRYAKGNGFDTLLTTGERSYKNSLKDFLRAMDYEEGFPKAVCKFTRSQVISFFKGMYASDGYVYQRKDGKNVEIGLSASNHFLYAQYCRELLNKLGMPAKIKRERMSKNKDGSLFNRVLITGQRNVLTFKNTIEIPDKPVPESNYSFIREVKTFSGEDGEVLKYGLVNNIKKVDGTYKVYDVEYKDKGWFICSGVKVHNSGKSESVAVTCGGLMIILPTLANMPMFAEDKRLQMFKNGVMIGIFAPSQRQAQTTYGKIKARIQSKTAQAVLSDPEFNLEFTVSNGTTVALSNGSFVTAISASDGANIEGESFHLVVCEETQDISDFKLKKCLTGDTRILTPDGSYKRLDNIVRDKNSKVVKYSSDLLSLTPDYPIEYYDNGVQPVYELRLNNGDKIKATLNHQFLTFSKNTKKVGPKFRTVQDIIDSQCKYTSLQIGVPDSLPFFSDDNPLDYEKGLIIGSFLGDGCFKSSPAFIGEAEKNERLLKFIRKAIDPNINMTEYNKGRYPNSDSVAVHFSTPSNKKGSNTLKEYFKSVGLWGLSGQNKVVPEGVHSKSYYKGLLEGLFDTDGCIENYKVKPCISFSNISETLVLQMKDILLKFGIHSVYSIRENTNRNGAYGHGENKPLHMLFIKSVKDIRRFCSIFYLQTKQPFLDIALETIKDKQDRNTSKHYPSTVRFYKVTDIIYVGEEPTYCLKTEDRNFIANNMISSNSILPMGSAYNATIVKIGTPSNRKGDFYEVIQRNKREYEEGIIKRRNHFEYNGDYVAKYNPKYAKALENAKKRLGENSDEFQISYCVTPETKILTSDLRWVEAGKLKVGDKLTGFDEDKPKRYGQRKFKESVIEDIGCIQRPCYEVILNDGSKIRCSKEHQWLVFTAGSRTEWKQTKDLVPTDRIYKVCDTWDSLPNDYRLGYLSAAFDGEGCLSQVGGKISQICFSQRDNAMLKQVKSYLTDFGFDYNSDCYDKKKVAEGYEPVYKLFIKGGRREQLRFLGSVRPKRLLENFNPNDLGTVRCSNNGLGGDIHPRVVSLKPIGNQQVIPIRTSTRTYIANGFASHNCLKWILERGMFVDIEKFEQNNVMTSYDTVLTDKSATHVAGIDIGGGGDATVITICEVDWSMPVVMESKIDEETHEEIMYQCYNVYLKAWHMIQGVSDYEEQYGEIVDFLSRFKIARVVCDATREKSIADRLNANLPYEVVPYVFSSKSKSDLYKHFDHEILSGRFQIPGGSNTQDSAEYKRFMFELGNMEKTYRGSYMVVAHPNEKNAHDDFPDSASLAVWGCSSEGYVNQTETRDSKSLFGKNYSERSYYSSRNKMTARRRK